MRGWRSWRRVVAETVRRSVPRRSDLDERLGIERMVYEGCPNAEPLAGSIIETSTPAGADRVERSITLTRSKIHPRRARA